MLVSCTNCTQAFALENNEYTFKVCAKVHAIDIALINDYVDNVPIQNVKKTNPGNDYISSRSKEIYDAMRVSGRKETTFASYDYLLNCTKQIWGCILMLEVNASILRDIDKNNPIIGPSGTVGRELEANLREIVSSHSIEYAQEKISENFNGCIIKAGIRDKTD